MNYRVVYVLYIKRARFFHPPSIHFSSLGSAITLTENACLKSTPALLRLHYTMVLVQGQITDLCVAKSVVNSQSSSYETSHQHLPWLATPSYLIHFLQWLLAHPILLVFLLVTGCSSSVPCWFPSSCLPLNVGGPQGLVLDPLPYLYSLPVWSHQISWLYDHLCTHDSLLYASTKSLSRTPGSYNNCLLDSSTQVFNGPPPTNICNI